MARLMPARVDALSGWTDYVAAVTSAPADADPGDRWHEEVPFRSSPWASTETLLRAAWAALETGYVSDLRIVGLSCEETGEVVAEDWRGVIA